MKYNKIMKNLKKDYGMEYFLLKYFKILMRILNQEKFKKKHI